MMWWGGGEGGMSAGSWVGMGLFWIAVLALSVWGLRFLFPRETDSRDPNAALERKLAAGEISLQEYERISAERGAAKKPSPRTSRQK